MVGYVFGEYGWLAGYGYTLDQVVKSQNTPSQIDGLGLMIGINSSKCFLQGQSFGTQGSLLCQRLYSTCSQPIILLGNRYAGAVSSASNANLRFASVGYGLEDWQVARFTEIVNSFQTTLYRNACN
jgi:hypothetical protein